MKALAWILLVACSVPAPEHSVACHVRYTCDFRVWGPEWVQSADDERVQELWFAGQRLCDQYLATYVCQKALACDHACVPYPDAGVQ